MVRILIVAMDQEFSASVRVMINRFEDGNDGAFLGVVIIPAYNAPLAARDWPLIYHGLKIRIIEPIAKTAVANAHHMAVLRYLSG